MLRIRPMIIPVRLSGKVVNAPRYMIGRRRRGTPSIGKRIRRNGASGGESPRTCRAGSSRTKQHGLRSSVPVEFGFAKPSM